VPEPRSAQILPDWLKPKGRGHLTPINDILAKMMEAEQRAGRDR
jgi:hypothetical protein